LAQAALPPEAEGGILVGCPDAPGVPAV